MQEDGAADRVTIAVAREVEIDRIKGSRFVATLVPCPDEAAARTVIDDVRQRHADASHHCWAFRLADGRALADDDGEPRDSAGAPILRHLGGSDLVDVVCVVTRWFGGTKLGRGGLVRAYGDAAATAIDASEVVVHVATTTVTMTHAYDATGPVDGALAAAEAVITDEVYGADVTRTVLVRVAAADALVASLRDVTAGRVTFDVS